MDKVRIGVIGVGGMGQAHCDYMNQLDLAELTAVCDINPETAREVGEKYRAPHFIQYSDLLDSGLVDAVIIATPHYFHTPSAIEAFKRGIHVLCEKPIAVTVGDATAMIKAAEGSGKVFGVMYQMRTEPLYRTARKLMEEERLGEIFRVSGTFDMYRSQAYYDSAGWRATWSGEGGGVLLNQAPHVMDLFIWLVGMPKFVTGKVRTRIHNIEVEDEAFATLEFPNGAHGYFHANTVACPELYRIEICGDRGKLLLDENGLRLYELKPSIRQYTEENTEVWGRPETSLVETALLEGESGHSIITQNFCRAIRYGEELIAPGREGLWQVELTDAIILSSYREKTVQLPLKASEYEELISDLRNRSRTKRTRRPRIETDPRHKK